MINKEKGSYPIKKISATDQVYTLLFDNINSNTWEKGQKLPSETELANSLGVNRVTIRMALQRLSVLGLIETRVGEGSFVTGTNFSENIGEYAKCFMVPDVINDVEEFRHLIETRCLELAVQNATDEEIDELEVCLHHFDQCKAAYAENQSEATFNDLLNADFNFHHKLCTLSHNLLYSYAFAMAKEPICRFIGFIINERDDRIKEGSKIKTTASTDVHMQICRALRDRDIETCRKHFLLLLDYEK
jgi:Transcriptional regulators